MIEREQFGHDDYETHLFYVTSPGIAIDYRQHLSMIQFIGNTSDKEDGAI